MAEEPHSRACDRPGICSVFCAMLSLILLARSRVGSGPASDLDKLLVASSGCLAIPAARARFGWRCRTGAKRDCSPGGSCVRRVGRATRGGGRARVPFMSSGALYRLPKKDDRPRPDNCSISTYTNTVRSCAIPICRKLTQHPSFRLLHLVELEPSLPLVQLLPSDARPPPAQLVLVAQPPVRSKRILETDEIRKGNSALLALSQRLSEVVLALVRLEHACERARDGVRHRPEGARVVQIDKAESRVPLEYEQLMSV